MRTAAPSTPTPSRPRLAAPRPLDRPKRQGRVVRVPEHWTGPLSGAPFEAVLGEAGRICLGVGLECPKKRLRTGSLWILCEDGADLIAHAQALDTALALAGSQTPTALSSGVPAERLLEALVWMEAGAERTTTKDSGTGRILVSGARSLFAERAKLLKKALRQILPPNLAAMAEPSPSAALH